MIRCENVSWESFTLSIQAGKSMGRETPGDGVLRSEEVGFNLDILGFDASEIADITLGKDVNQPEYDESAASTVSMITCPECRRSFPKIVRQ
jgi:hypothetical protein